MYQVKPVCGDVQVDLPSCMYRVTNIHQSAGNTSQPCQGRQHASVQNGEVDPAIRALETRQDDIMRRLYELKAAVDGLAKTVATPDADLDSSSLSGSAHSPAGSSSSPLNAAFRGTADLDALLGKDMGALRDIVINANPAQPPLTLLVLHSLLCQRYRVLSTVHVHSSVSGVPQRLLSCLGPPHRDSYDRQRFQLGFTLIWKDVPKLQMKFSVQNMCPIEGEASVARFLYRLLAPYPSDPGTATLVDSWVDTAFWQLAQGSVKDRRALTAALGSNPWLCGPELTLADIACYCCTLQSAALQGDRVDMSASPANVLRWLKACDNLGHFDGVKLLLQ